MDSKMYPQRQHQQQRSLLSLKDNKDNKDKNNRLDVQEDGTSAKCDVVGLLAFNSSLPLQFGYQNALAIELAVRHLNTGNDSLVSELSGLRETCPITFSVSFADTHRSPRYSFAAVDALTRSAIDFSDLVLPLKSNHSSLQDAAVAAAAASSTTTGEELEDVFVDTANELEEQSLMNVVDRQLPCAFIGAIDSEVSRTTALVTGMRGFPQVSPSSTSASLSNQAEFPLFGRTIPSDRFAAEIFIRFLHDILGVRHIYVIFESHHYTRSVLRGLHEAINRLGWAPGNDNDEEQAMHVKERSIESRSLDADLNTTGSITEAVLDLKKSQFRFVVALTTDQKTNDELMVTAYNYAVAGANDGTHHWWFFDSFTGIIDGRTFEKDSILAKAYNGTGSIQQTSDVEGDTYTAFVEQSRELKRELYQGYYDSVLIAADDVTVDMSWDEWLFASDVPFLNEKDWFLDGKGYTFDSPAYSYDATILVGLSACREIAASAAEGTTDNRPLYLTGEDFYKRIKRTNFTGITGNVLLDPDTGTRDGHTVQYSIKNWLAGDDDFDPIEIDITNSSRSNNDTTTNTVTFQSTITHQYVPGGDDDWNISHPYIFNGGKTSLGEIPDLPPVELKINNVSQWVQGLGFTLAAIILIATAGFAIWTHLRRKCRVVRASQPFFLHLLCFGIAIMAFSMIPMSLDHSVESATDTTCNSLLWLLVIGFGVTFSALFAKTLRINRIMASAMQCRRIKLSVRDTLYPVVIISFFNLIMLSFMLGFRPVSYQIFRENEDMFGRETEAHGRCVYQESLPFVIPIAIVNLSMVCLALFQAWRARNLSTEFAESKYIANALFISFIASILACPILIVVKDDPDANTFITTTLVFILTSSTLCFMFIPKIIYHIHGNKSSVNEIAASFQSFTTRVSPAGSGSRYSTGEGERILTTKPQETLASEIKTLEHELATMKNRERTLEAQNAVLEKRLREANEKKNCKKPVSFSEDFSKKSVSFNDDLGKQSSSIRNVVLPVQSKERSFRLSAYEPSVLMAMVEELHSEEIKANESKSSSSLGV